MKQQTLIALICAGIIAVLGGWYFGTRTTPAERGSVTSGKLMFPNLTPKLKDATKIEVIHQGKPMVIALEHDHWGVAEKGGYPVQEGKLRGMLTGLTELRLVEPRTSDPAQFSRLGVEDPDAKDSNSNRLRVLDAADKPIVDVIVGHRRVRTQGNVPEQVYVRRPGENQAWLAEGSLQVDSDPQLWLDRDVLNIEHGRIARVEATRGGQTLVFSREGDKLALIQPAEHPKLDDYKVEDVARALELLSFQDVRPAAAAAPGELAGHSVFHTTSGLAITATLFHADKDLWVRFAVAGEGTTRADNPTADNPTASNQTAGNAKDGAGKLSARLSGWDYQLGSWKEKSLVPSMDNLKAAEKTSEPVPDAAAPAAGIPAAPAAGIPAAPGAAK
jgi:hypothetical protein